MFFQFALALNNDVSYFTLKLNRFRNFQLISIFLLITNNWSMLMS